LIILFAVIAVISCAPAPNPEPVPEPKADPKAKPDIIVTNPYYPYATYYSSAYIPSYSYSPIAYAYTGLGKYFLITFKRLFSKKICIAFLL
jgi:hypothetical protein